MSLCVYATSAPAVHVVGAPKAVHVVREDAGNASVSVAIEYDDGGSHAVATLDLEDLLTVVVEAARIGGPALGRHIGGRVLELVDHLGPPPAVKAAQEAADDKVVVLRADRYTPVIEDETC